MKRRTKMMFLTLICVSAIFGGSGYSTGESQMNKESVDLISKFTLENANKIVIKPLKPESELIVSTSDLKVVKPLLSGLNQAQRTLIDTLCNYRIVFYKSDMVLVEFELHHDINYPASAFFRYRTGSHSYEDYLVSKEAAILISSMISKSNKEAKMAQLSKNDVIKIANREAEALGYNVKTMTLNLDENNTAWNGYNKNNIVLRDNPEIESKLQGKQYWAVYYGPKELQFGGDLWIFIEKESGDVITYIKGE